MVKTYPNIELISRDGASICSKAATESHPGAKQVTDRFHLIKSLSEAVDAFLTREYSSRIAIPRTEKKSIEIEALYSTANRSQRIRFAKAKRNEGMTESEIASLLHSATLTVRRYLAIPDEEIPEDSLNALELKHERTIASKKQEAENARRLYEDGYSVERIGIIMHHNSDTIKRLLDPANEFVNGHYDVKMNGKLAPYHDEIIEMRSKGIPYTEIHRIISLKGYQGSVAALRMFIQKERSHVTRLKQENEDVEYVARKSLSRLIYQKLDKVTTITKEQFEAVLGKYPQLAHVYDLLGEFRKIMFSKDASKLESWMERAECFDIPEIQTFINSTSRDITAVRNAIENAYSNGLAEGSVNKIKVVKRIMYGRNSFELLRAKVLLREIKRCEVT